MTARPLSICVVGVWAALAGCSSSSESNPPELWLAPLNGEVDVQLEAQQPPTF